eukprot:CAMPEP_0174351874 /NCGR_PEP_ID=MMETSP0811_2-20130205/9385_1 /TAXON_ID=73025 ORGANISM="Eutreptiella gymnastica-like, Strain CCMP1594" /NCGR_SAMPLE_ID=MMETSP0811_2 /ASSEMBLY_ACC=CAM_ASM_000667 /LENGTH=62 /DNA_ID=CAMNT_0015481537 /DNA_START=282 /DNA_END=470 /DNA_ORIENTATION=+
MRETAQHMYSVEWHMSHKMQAQKITPSEFWGVLKTHSQLNATLLGKSVQTTVPPTPGPRGKT